MRTKLLSALLVCAPALAGAQRASVAPSPRAFVIRTSDEGPRAVIGIDTDGRAGARDTLGLLITSIVPNSPAEKAGLDEGNRLISVNGQNLRLAASDIGDREMGGLMQRRLVRELDKVKPGDDVELKVWSGGQVRTVRVKTAAADSLYPERQRMTREEWKTVRDERPALGLGLGASGTKRDTLGVFVSSVVDSGPAALAGIIEGARIASINGVDVRVSRSDAGDAEVASAKARRLQREVEKLKPGSDVELRVWQEGQYRTFKVKVARAGDLPQSAGFYFFGGDGAMPPMPPMPPMPAMAPMVRMSFPTGW